MSSQCPVDEQLPNGYNLSYVDSSTTASRSSALELYKRSLDDKNRPVALIGTLLQLEGTRFDVNTTMSVHNNDELNSTGRSRYLLYNDQPSEGPPSGSLGVMCTSCRPQPSGL